ncbi:tail fiber domain-containing protein [Sulfurovum sp. CS9]|uniref:tail fiber domain-containing protein n=1 Tax=Sulfurovum sp. CS9 TaxID=3391146 RepID=UPI0039E98A7D
MKNIIKISSIAALLLIGTTAIMAETTPDAEEMFNEPEPPIHYEELLPHETDGIVTEAFEGDSNTYYGLGAGNVGGGSVNSFFGRSAGFSNTGAFNTFSGYESGYSNTTGSWNTFIGMRSGYRNTEGLSNTFIGVFSGLSNTTGSDNTFIGMWSGNSNTEGLSNTFIGRSSGLSNTTGGENTFSGVHSGSGNTTGWGNTFSGDHSGYSNTTGHQNTFIGRSSGSGNTAGYGNTFSGYCSGYSNTTGGENTFSGIWSGYSNTIGRNNTFSGYKSGRYNQTGSYNVFLGSFAGYNETGSNKLYIDNSTTATPLIYGEFDNDLVRVNGNFETTDTITSTWVGSNTEGDGLTNLLVLSADNSEADLESDAGFGLKNARADIQWNFRTHQNGTAFVATLAGTGGPEFTVKNATSNVSGTELYLGNGARNVGGVWYNASSRELKENIKELSTQDALAAFHKLQPVTYNYKSDKKEQVVGFIAEDVPELVAIQSRDGLSAMDMVAVLTKVVQETRAEAEAKDQKIAMMEAKIAKLELMEKKVAMMESILTNLALDTSKTQKGKVSLNLK